MDRERGYPTPQVAVAVLLTKAAALDFGGEAHLLDNWSYSEPLNPNFFYLPTNAFKINVPQETPPGEYYLAVFAADQDINKGAAIEAFPFSYTTAFSKTKVKVVP